MKINNQQIIGQSLYLNDDEIRHVLGPNLSLVDCEIKIACATDVIIAGVNMHGGVFSLEKPLTDRQLYRFSFDRVRFYGTYSGCDFGNRDKGHGPGVIDCDFSGATLDNCRMMNVDIAGCIFSGWPTVVLGNPRTKVHQLQS